MVAGPNVHLRLDRLTVLPVRGLSGCPRMDTSTGNGGSFPLGLVHARASRPAAASAASWIPAGGFPDALA